MKILRLLQTAILASTTSGIVIGLLARLAMTALTLLSGTSNNFSRLTFTVPGTIRILVVPMLFGIPFALMLVAIRRYLPGQGWRKLLSYGVVTFIFPGLLSLADSSFKLNEANQTWGLALFASLNFTYGFLLGMAIEYLERPAQTSEQLPAGSRWMHWQMVAAVTALLVTIVLFRWSDVIAFRR